MNEAKSEDLPSSFSVILVHSENEYISYPASGRLQITEAFTNGDVDAVFQSGEYKGCEFIHVGPPVRVKSPRFKHNPSR